MADYSGIGAITTNSSQYVQPAAVTNPITCPSQDCANKNVPNISVNINLDKPIPVHEIPTEAIKALYFPQFKTPEETDTQPKLLSYRD